MVLVQYDLFLLFYFLRLNVVIIVLMALENVLSSELIRLAFDYIVQWKASHSHPY